MTEIEHEKNQRDEFRSRVEMLLAKRISKWLDENGEEAEPWDETNLEKVHWCWQKLQDPEWQPFVQDYPSEEPINRVDEEIDGDRTGIWEDLDPNRFRGISHLEQHGGMCYWRRGEWCGGSKYGVFEYFFGPIHDMARSAKIGETEFEGNWRLGLHWEFDESITYEPGEEDYFVGEELVEAYRNAPYKGGIYRDFENITPKNVTYESEVIGEVGWEIEFGPLAKTYHLHLR